VRVSNQAGGASSTLKQGANAMNMASGAAIFLWQDDLSRHDTHLMMIFVGLIALALLMQGVGFIIAAIFGAKLLHRADDR